MKIIAGALGGQSIPGRPNPHLRPTSDKVKEAIFDQVQARFVDSWEGLRVLDLFAGTGSLGFEALSRGASQAVFVDHHLQTVKAIQKAAEHLGLKDRSEVICKGALDGIRWLEKRGDVFDLIFMDPPYREDWIVGTLNALMGTRLLSKRSKIIVERDKRELITSVVSNWKLETERRYGDSMVSILSPL
jgi:16S rRNA (guanine(966)-N(2))-methyltransferase RsmD